MLDFDKGTEIVYGVVFIVGVALKLAEKWKSKNIDDNINNETDEESRIIDDHDKVIKENSDLKREIKLLDIEINLVKVQTANEILTLQDLLRQMIWVIGERQLTKDETKKYLLNLLRYRGFFPCKAELIAEVQTIFDGNENASIYLKVSPPNILVESDVDRRDAGNNDNDFMGE